MIKLLSKTFFTIILFLVFAIIYLSIFGIKTKKFNNEISSNILKINKKINISLNDVNYKLNPFKFEINVSTENPKILLSESKLEIKNIETITSLKSLISGKFSIDNLKILTKEIKVKDVISLARTFQNSPELFILDKVIKEGVLSADINLNFDSENKIKNNYIIKGFVKNGNLGFINKYEFKDLDFEFNITSNQYLFNEIESNFNEIGLISPLIEINKKNDLFFFNGSILNDNKNFNIQNLKILVGDLFTNINLKKIRFSSNNDFSFNISKKLKIKDLKINSIIDLDELDIDEKSLYLKSYFPNSSEKIKLKNHKVKINFSKNILDIKGDGNFLFKDKMDFLTYKITKKDNQISFDTKIDIKNSQLNISLLDYVKKEGTVSTILIKGIKNKNQDLLFKLISLNENNNKILINNLFFNKNFKIINLAGFKANYINNKDILNEFEFKKNNSKFTLQGINFDASELINTIMNSKETNVSIFKNFNPKIDINLTKTYIDKNNYINNLSGYLSFKNDKINELNLISTFPNNEKINLSIVTNKKNETTTKLSSSYPKPLVERYDFIKGFEEGILDFHSFKKNDKSNSVLIIRNFKVKEVPVLAKLLSLASLQGIADLLTGEGIRFTDFEMIFSNEKNLITIEEIYAIGPAVSMLMSGYIEKEKLISLRGTLVPATTINKTIASIPLLGKILVGEKAGEGVFGVSFKIKGPPKNLKTTVNPIKTLTPRFITRTLEKIKKTN